MIRNSEKANEIFASILLEEAHIDYVNECIENIYDKIGELNEFEEDTLNFLMNEKNKTLDRIHELKIDYNQALVDQTDTCTGKIEINYENIPDEKRFQLYRFLNSMCFSTPGFNYKTVENTTHFSKDFAK